MVKTNFIQYYCRRERDFFSVERGLILICVGVVELWLLVGYERIYETKYERERQFH